MEEAVVNSLELRKRGVWHFQAYSKQANHITALLKKSPFPVHSLRTLVSENAVRGFSMVSSEANDGVPVLTARNVSAQGVNFQDVSYITIEEHNKLVLTQVQTDDLLVRLVGQPGISALYRYAEPSNLSSTLARLRLKQDVYPEYLVSYLNSDIGQSLVLSLTTGTLRPIVTLEALMDLPVILPPLTEQKRIANQAHTLEREAAKLIEDARGQQAEARNFSNLLEGGSR